MFEKYGNKARRTIACARDSALAHHAVAIEPAHLLFGALIADPETVRQLSLRQDVSAEALVQALRTLLPQCNEGGTAEEIPLSSKAREVLILANEVSQGGNKSHIGVEHLVVGILKLRRPRWWRRSNELELVQFLSSNGFDKTIAEERVRSGAVSSAEDG